MSFLLFPYIVHIKTVFPRKCCQAERSVSTVRGPAQKIDALSISCSLLLPHCNCNGFWFFGFWVLVFIVLISHRLSVKCWRVFSGLQWCKVAGGYTRYISFQLGFCCVLGFSCEGPDVRLIPFDLGFPFFIHQCKNFKSVAFFFFFPIA